MVSDDGEHFIPHVIHIEEGRSVTWVRESGGHTTTACHPETHGDHQRIPDSADPWASDFLSEEGVTFEQTFDTEGVYDYVCTPHEDMGMVGSIIVGWPDPDGQPGLEPPAADLPEATSESIDQYNDQVREVLEEGGHHDHLPAVESR